MMVRFLFQAVEKGGKIRTVGNRICLWSVEGCKFPVQRFKIILKEIPDLFHRWRVIDQLAFFDNRLLKLDMFFRDLIIFQTNDILDKIARVIQQPVDLFLSRISSFI